MHDPLRAENIRTVNREYYKNYARVDPDIKPVRLDRLAPTQDVRANYGCRSFGVVGGFGCKSTSGPDEPGFPYKCARPYSNIGALDQTTVTPLSRNACDTAQAFLVSYTTNSTSIWWNCDYPAGPVNCDQLLYNQQPN